MAQNLLELKIQQDVLREAQNLWDTFESTLGQRGVRKLEKFATVNAARALAPYVKAEAPQHTGLLAKSIRGRRSRLIGTGAVVGPVGGAKHAWYGWFVVRGTTPHRMPKQGTIGKIALMFNAEIIHSVEHPGNKANNFVDRAVAAHIQVGQDAFGATIALIFQSEQFRHKILGMEIMYANRTPRDWAHDKTMQFWDKPDYVEPLPGTLAAEAKRRRVETENIKKITRSARLSRLKAEAEQWGIDTSKYKEI
jgi:hypothetical protein